MKFREIDLIHRRRFARPVAVGLLSALLTSGASRAQGPPRGFWPVADSTAAHSRWQKAETDITTKSVATNFKFLWKIKLGDASADSSFSEPLLFPGLITGRGFKDLAFVADSHTLYAVDSELGQMVWQKDFPSGANKACGNLEVLAEPPQVIHFGARKPGAPRPPPEAPVAPSARRVGGSAGGGYFGLKGVYVLTSDGYLHEQIMATGLDYAPAVKFLPETKGSSFALNINDKVVYTVAESGCHNEPGAVWSIDLNTPAYTVNNYQSQKATLAGLSGPAIGTDGTVYIATGNGPAGEHANSVVALTAKDLKVKDWYTYTPSGTAKTLDAGPVVFTYKDKELVAAPGEDGGIVLLDSHSLGGADHHTPLADSWVMSKAGKRGDWEGLATWQDKAGVCWIFASIDGPVALNFPATTALRLTAASSPSRWKSGTGTPRLRRFGSLVTSTIPRRRRLPTGWSLRLTAAMHPPMPRCMLSMPRPVNNCIPAATPSSRTLIWREYRLVTAMCSLPRTTTRFTLSEFRWSTSETPG